LASPGDSRRGEAREGVRALKIAKIATALPPRTAVLKHG
jgi:hypothetical protein